MKIVPKCYNVVCLNTTLFQAFNVYQNTQAEYAVYTMYMYIVIIVQGITATNGQKQVNGKQNKLYAHKRYIV